MFATTDHCHPMYWGAVPQESSAMMGALVWDGAANVPREMAVKRHLEGFNNLYADGHAKWGRFGPLTSYPNADASVAQGDFHPR